MITVNSDNGAREVMVSKWPLPRVGDLVKRECVSRVVSRVKHDLNTNCIYIILEKELHNG